MTFVLKYPGNFLPPELEQVDRGGKWETSEGQYEEGHKKFSIDPSSSEPGEFPLVIPNCTQNGAA